MVLGTSGFLKSVIYLDFTNIVYILIGLLVTIITAIVLLLVLCLPPMNFASVPVLAQLTTYAPTLRFPAHDIVHVCGTPFLLCILWPIGLLLPGTLGILGILTLEEKLMGWMLGRVPSGILLQDGWVAIVVERFLQGLQKEMELIELLCGLPKVGMVQTLMRVPTQQRLAVKGILLMKTVVWYLGGLAHSLLKCVCYILHFV